MGGKRYIYWILTIPREKWIVPEQLPDSIKWIKGQPEVGAGGYKHWQLIVGFATKQSLRSAKLCFPKEAHLEPSRSSAAEEYVWKDESRDGESFELGFKPLNPSSKTDWEMVWDSARLGRIMEIPASVRVQHYRTLRAIGSDYSVAPALVRSCDVFWGPTGTGKSRRAWEEAGINAYCKGPRSKFWDGYQGEANVVLDEFRGGIDVSYLLRWLDRYPVRVEIKGSSMPLLMEKMWITSNLDPRRWYPELDFETVDALLRRLNIIHFT